MGPPTVEDGDSSVLVKLGVLDTMVANTTNVLFGYVLKKQENIYDAESLARAVRRVTDKWRLLAGRFEWDKEGKMFHIRVPTGELTKEAFKFTTATYKDTISSVSLLESHVAVQPNRKFFHDQSTPISLSRYASRDHPFLSIHVSHLDDATCIGVTFPHGIFDAIGGGTVVKAISAELSGQQWVPPSMVPHNLVDTAFAELAKSPDMSKKPIPAAVNYEQIWIPIGFFAVIKYFAILAYEYIFHKPVIKNVFLDREVVDRMAYEVKTQVTSNGSSRWVSTGDILMAWFLKTALAGDRDLPAVTAAFPVSFREVLSPMDSNFNTNPHNTMAVIPLPKFSTSWFNSATIAEVALKHRDLVQEVRTLPFVQSLARVLARRVRKGSGLLLLRHFNEPYFTLSNQVMGGPADISFGPGTELEAFWEWILPISYDGTGMLNKLKGGYVFTATMRESRWKCVEKEIERIKSGGSFA